jgi:nitrite reductase (NADH) small subunit
MNDDFVRVTELSQLPQGEGRVFRVCGRSIALFRIDRGVFALANSCAHRDGPLGEGSLEGNVVTCPVHGWQFDVTSGVCVGRPGRTVATFPVRLEDDSVFVAVPAVAQSTDASHSHALIRFGAMGYVGRFQVEPTVSLGRGGQVVVQSSRGMEVGELLWSGSGDSELVTNQPDSGIVLRELTDADAAAAKLLRDRIRPAFEECRTLLEERGVPVDLIDAEQLLDGQTIIFYFLGEAIPALADLTTELATRFESHVQFRPFGNRIGDACGSCHSDGEHGCGNCSEDGSCGREGNAGGCQHSDEPADSP